METADPGCPGKWPLNERHFNACLHHLKQNWQICQHHWSCGEEVIRTGWNHVTSKKP